MLVEDTAARLSRQLRLFVTAFESRTTVVDISTLPALLVEENPLRWSIRFSVPIQEVDNVEISPFAATSTDTLNFIISQITGSPFLYKDDPLLATASWFGTASFGSGNIVIFEQFLRN